MFRATLFLAFALTAIGLNVGLLHAAGVINIGTGNAQVVVGLAVFGMLLAVALFVGRSVARSMTPQPSLEAKLIQRAKNARHEALFSLALLLLNLLLLRGIALPLGGLLVALWSLYRVGCSRDEIRQNGVGKGLLRTLSVTAIIASVSAALSVLALVLNLMYQK